MKKNAVWITAIAVIVILVVILLVKSTSQPGFESIPAEIPGEVVYVPFPVNISIDGDGSDWEKLPEYTVDRGPNPASSPEENGSFAFSVAADPEYFYIKMDMPDQNIIAGEHGTDFWNEDSMEFYLNASEDLNTRVYGDKIFQANINAADIGNTDPQALTITGVNSADYAVEGFVFKTDDGWGFEASVPLKDLFEPKHGLEIGFQAQINGASELDRDTKLIWSKADTTDQSWQLPILFGRAVFFELGRKDIPQASVAEVLPTVTPTSTPVVIPSQISVNQTGYFPQGKKIASIAMGVLQPVSWQLMNKDGEIVASGETTLFGKDATSGDYLHWIDFSEVQLSGDGFFLSAHGLKSVPFTISERIYNPLTVDALAYFYHNRSGIAIEADFVGENYARPAGHVTDNAVTCYQGTDAEGTTWPGCDYTLDVSGGWYDAGDFGKYVVNGGISVWTLQNLYERFPLAFPDGSLNIPEKTNGIPDILDEARWEMEFLLSMQVPQGENLAGMAHHKIHDLNWAGMPMVPPTEVENNNQFNPSLGGRYLYPPSTAATLNLAAAGAQCARIWRTLDPAFAERCLTAAETAWASAKVNPALFAGNTPGSGGGNYDDLIVEDEFYWAAAELFITTGQAEYEQYLIDSPLLGFSDSFDWGNTAALGTLALAAGKNDLTTQQFSMVKESILTFADEMIEKQAQDGYAVLIKGEYPWGSNGLILNNMILVSTAYDLSADSRYLDAVRLSMDYILGRNPNNLSYVSGYGTYTMQHPHHRFWANQPDLGFPAPPPGVVSGGPNANPTDDAAITANLMEKAPSKRYLDEIDSYTTNEVTINWNAPLVWVSTYLDQVSK